MTLFLDLRSLWKTDKGENRNEGETYAGLLEDYEARERFLIVKNAELKKVLKKFQKEMVSIVTTKTAIGEVPDSLEPVCSAQDKHEE